MLVDDEGRGNRGDAKRPRETVFEVHRLLPAGLLEEGLDHGQILIGVNGKKEDVLALFVPLFDFLVNGMLYATRGAPGGPEIQHQHAAAERAEQELFTAKPGEGELHRVLDAGVRIALPLPQSPGFEEGGGAVVRLEDQIAEAGLRAMVLAVKLTQAHAVPGAVAIRVTRVGDGEGISEVRQGLFRLAGLVQQQSDFARGLSGGIRFVTASGERDGVFKTPEAGGGACLAKEGASEAAVEFFAPLRLRAAAPGLVLLEFLERGFEALGVLPGASGAVAVVCGEEGVRHALENLQVVPLALQRALPVQEDAPLVVGFDGRLHERPFEFFLVGGIGKPAEMNLEGADELDGT